MKRGTVRISASLLLFWTFLLTACFAQQNNLSNHSTSTETSTPEIVASPTAFPSSTVSPPTITPSPTSTSKPESGEATIGDSYTPELGNSGYDVQKYLLSFSLDPSDASVHANANIDAVVSLPAINRLSMDFAGFDIEQLKINNQDAIYEREGHKLWIDLPEVLNMGQSFSIMIQYSGPPLIEPSPYVPFLGHVGLYYPGGIIFTLSEPNGASYWYPANDHPLDKAEFLIQLTVPAQYVGVSIGNLTSVIDNSDGTKTHTWELNYPTATYLAMLAVGNYIEIEDRSPEGIPIRNYIFPERRDEFNTFISLIGEALDWMSDLYGPYPFDNFGFVTTRLVNMASETQTMVILPETSINEETLVHEIAHMWFGDWVSLESWGDMWLKEGPAIYTYLLWQTRANPADLDIFMQERTTRLLEESQGYPLRNLPKSQLLGTDTYWKGAVVFHALRKEIGDDAFFAGLRDYISTYGGANASFDEFVNSMETASDQDLSDFFEFWVDES